MLKETQKRALTKAPDLLIGSAVTLVGAAFIDQLFGAHGNATRRTTPEFHTARHEGARHTLGVLPGCQTNSRLLFKNLLSLSPGANLITADYPEHGFDVEAVCEGLAAQLLEAKAKRPALLCRSMGGIVMRHFMEYAEQTGVSEKLEGFGPIVLDSSPFDFSDVQNRSKRLLETASAPIVYSSYTVDFLKRHIYPYFADSMAADAHLDTIRSEGAFMRQEHPSALLPDIMENVYYVRSAYDSVVHTEQASLRYAAITPAGKFHDIVDGTRSYGQHTADYAQESFQLGLAGVITNARSLAA